MNQTERKFTVREYANLKGISTSAVNAKLSKLELLEANPTEANKKRIDKIKFGMPEVLKIEKTQHGRILTVKTL